MAFKSDLSVKHDSVRLNPKPLPKISQEAEKSNFEGRIYKVEKMNESDKKEVKTLLSNYFQSNLEFHNAEKNLKEAKEEHEEILRESVKTILAEFVLKKTVKELNDFSKEKLNFVTINFAKKHLITSEEGMQEVIIPLAKKFAVKEIDLSYFKDQINGRALEIFLKAIPDTQITKVTISKAKIAVLNLEEKKQFIFLKSQKGITFISAP